MKKLSVLIAFIAFIGLSLVNAQTRAITGTVTSSEDGMGIPGANVVVKGTSIGVATDVDGRYTINVPENATVLVFSAMGFTDKEVAISGSTINVVLAPASIDIDEVVVVAYGTATKKSFTGSATQVSAEKLERKGVSEVSKALAGEIAGVSVINTSGQPGSNATIRIRGFGSVNASAAPLYIVDGVPYSGDISAIDPSDIEATSVLKDASATAIYGARGANGVILIKTKSGKKGTSSISVEVKTGVNMRLLSNYDVIDSPERYAELSWEGLRNRYMTRTYDPTAGTFTDHWNQANLDNGANYANTYLFSSASGTPGMNPVYNMWNADGADLIDPATGKFRAGVTRKYSPESWEDHIFRTGIKKEASLKMSGGNDKTQYYTSVGYLGDEGYYLESDFQRLNTRLNVNHKVKDWLTGSVNISYSNMETNNPGQGTNANNGFNFVNTIPALYPVYKRDADGKKIEDKKVGGYMYDYAFDADGGRRFSGGINPAGAIQLDKSENTSHQVTANSTLKAQITDEISAISTFGMQALISNTSTLTNPFYGDAAGVGRVYKDNDIYQSYTWTNMVKYTRTFGDAHHIDAFVAHEVTGYDRRVMFGRKNTIIRPDIAEWNNAIKMSSMGSYINDYSLESYFGQVKYDFDEKYFVYGTIRRDGSSRFTKDRWGTFGSAGVAWVVSSEDFMESLDFVKSLKFKASYGSIGNQSIGIYPTYDLYTTDNLNDKPGLIFSTKGNKDLTWESTNTFNTGIEFDLYGVVKGELEYYNKKTDNLLFQKRVAPSLGYAMYPVNDGKLTNQGFEFNILANVVNKSDFKVDFRVNGAFLTNEITKMPIENGTGKPKILDVQGVYAYAEGHSLYDFYMREWAGVDPETGQGQWNRYYYVDPTNPAADSDGKVTIYSYEEFLAGDNASKEQGVEKTFDYNNATQKFVDKSAIPTVNGAFGFDITYKNLTLTTQFLYSLGGYSYDGMYAGLMSNGKAGESNWSTDIENRWQKPGDVTDVPRINNDTDKNVGSASTRFLIKNDFLSLNNVRLTYDLPKKWLEKVNFSSASLSVAGDNLWLLTKRKGYIPNTSAAGDSNSFRYTPLSSITVGLKVQF